MTDEQLSRVLVELQRLGQLEVVLFVIREYMQQAEKDLRGHFFATALTDVPTVAMIHNLQGRADACGQLLTRLRTLANPPPAD